ncbi:MAG: RecX family transcriptional regulator [Bacilli bacterium]|nr:RecX family transcriptional regulator [Bacilli bacterium]
MNTMKENLQIIKITKVKQVGKSDKYKVEYLKEEPDAIVLLEDQIVNFRILKDKEFTIDEWQQIIDSSNMSVWFNKCLNFLSFKDRTTKEIKDYLRKNQISDLHIKLIIDRISNMRLLDDEAYAYKYLDEVVRKGKGLKYFKHQLEQKGVDLKIINKVSLDYPLELVIDDLIKQAQKHQVKLNTYPINYQKQKIQEKLLRDGFSSNVINQVFNEINFTANIEKRLAEEIKKLKTKTLDKNKITQKLLAKGYSYQDIKKYIS